MSSGVYEINHEGASMHPDEYVLK